MIKIKKKIYLYLFIVCVAIATAGLIALIAITSTGQADWHINFINATPIEILVGILGLVCAISGILSGVFSIIYVVKLLNN